MSELISADEARRMILDRLHRKDIDDESARDLIVLLAQIDGGRDSICAQVTTDLFIEKPAPAKPKKPKALTAYEFSTPTQQSGTMVGLPQKPIRPLSSFGGPMCAVCSHPFTSCDCPVGGFRWLN